MIERLDHIGVVVRDLEQATRRYATLLGRSPGWRGEHSGQGSANALFRLHNTYLELLSPRGEGAFGDRLRARLDAQGEGLLLLAFGTGALDDTHAELGERGLHPTAPASQLAQDTDSGAWRQFRLSLLPEEDTAGVLTLVVEHGEDFDALLPVSAPMAAEGACVEALDHVVVRTADPERALRHYGERLGLRLALDRSFEERGVRLLFFRTGGATVEVGAALRRGGELDAGDAPDDTLWGAAWRVADIDAAHARLEAAGIPTTALRDGNKPGTRVFTVESGTHGVPTLFIGPG